MAEYPDAVYAPRAKENPPGVVYTPALKSIGFVEDITKLDDEIVAVETELIANKNIFFIDIVNKKIVIRNLGESTIGIDLSNSGLSGSTDFIWYKAVDIKVTASGVFYGSAGNFGSRSKAGYFGPYKTDADLILKLGHDGYDISFMNANSVELMTVQGNGKVGIGTSDPKSKLHVVGIPVYANNAAAIVGGLTAGAFYRTGADPDPVCIVH